MKNRVIKNIFSSWGLFSVITFIRFFLTPLFVHKLGDYEYGIWILILSIIGYMELFSLGFNTANVRYLSRYFESKDHKSINEVFNSGLFIFMSLGVIVLIATLTISPFLGHMFKSMNNFVYIIIFIIAGVNLSFEFVFMSFSTVLEAREKYVETNIISASVFILRSVIAVILLLSGFKLLAIVINQAVFNIIKGMIIFLYSVKTNPNLKISYQHVNMGAIKTLGNFSVYIFIINITQKINLHASSLIIAYFMSPSAITPFAIGSSLIIYLKDFISAIPRVLIPRFSQIDAADNQDKIREYFLSFTRITLIISIPIVFIFIFYGRSLISLWIGEKYANLSGSILAVLSIGHLCRISQLTTHSVLKSTGRHKALSYFTMLESISIIILSIIFIKPYGLIGLAFAQTIGMVIVNLSIIPIYSCRELKIGISNYYMRYVFINALSLAPLFIIYYFLRSNLIDSIPIFGVIAAMIIGAYLISSYLFTLNMKEKEMLGRLVRLK